MYNFSQEQTFMLFFIIGIIIGILFDIFRAIRKNFKSSDFVTLIEDIVFLTLTTLLIILSIIRINGGEVRFYIFFGIFFGILIYSLTISNLCGIILNVIVRLCKKIFQIPFLISKKVIKLFKNIIKKSFLK